MGNIGRAISLFDVAKDHHIAEFLINVCFTIDVD
jgi:hypothetical protein